jgi:hypothetical protein
LETVAVAAKPKRISALGQVETRKSFRIRPLVQAKRDADGFLNDLQYLHLVSIVRNLKFWGQCDRMTMLDVKPIDRFFELREKGGPLGKINARVYFAVFPKTREIWVLGAYKKEDEGQTPKHIIVRIRNRLRQLPGGLP